MKYASHWHEPDRDRLLISVQRLADILGVEVHRAYTIAHSLDTRYYSEGGHHFRVTMASVKRYQELEREHGKNAIEIVRQIRQYGWSPTLERGMTPPSVEYHFRRRRRRRF